MQSKMLLQVHDELVFECPETEQEALSKIISQEMEGAMELEVPLLIQLGVGSNWLEAHQ